MANWQDPRPLFPWSQPPEPMAPRTAPKLRPNIYARMARFSVQNPVGVLLIVLFLLATSATVAFLNVTLDLVEPSYSSSASGQQATPYLQKFKNAGSAIRIDLSADAPGMANAAAISLSESLKTQTAIVDTVVMPGPDSLDPKFRPYFLPVADLKVRVDGVLALTPFYQLLAGSPSLSGLNNVIATMKAAADAGQAPAALAPLLDTLTQSVQRLADGKASTVAWPEAVGLSTLPPANSQTLFVIPRDGERAGVAEAARTLIEKLQAEKPFLNVTTNLPAAAAGDDGQSSLRQIVVALFLATLFLIAALLSGLREPRNVFFAVVPPGIACITAFGLAPLLIGALNSVSAMLPMLIVPGTIALSVPYVLALERHEKKAISPQSLIMLAAQQSGPYVATAAAVGAVTWASWWLLGGGVTRGLALTMTIGGLVSAAATFLVIPTLAYIIPRERSEIVPAAQLAPNPWTKLGPTVAAARPWVTMLLLALSALSALALAGSLFAPATTQLASPTSVYADDEEQARRIVQALQATPQLVGEVTWLGNFLPPDLDAKQLELKRLSALNLPVAPATATPAQEAEALLKKIDDGLRNLANHEALAEPIRANAQKLRRTITLVRGTAQEPATTSARIEAALFSGLPKFGAFVASSAMQTPPTPNDLPDLLRQMFVATDGAYRITVAPSSANVKAEDFAAALANTQPAASDFMVDDGNASRVVALRLLLALCIATLLTGILSTTVVRKPAAILSLMLTMAQAMLLFGGLAWLMGLGFTAGVSVAIVTGLACCAMACLWVLGEENLQWSPQFGFRHVLISSGAVLLPAIMMNLREFRGTSAALLMFLIVSALLAIFSAPKVEEWLSQLSLRKAKVVAPASKEPAFTAPAKQKQVSTKEPSGDKTDT